MMPRWQQQQPASSTKAYKFLDYLHIVPSSKWQATRKSVSHFLLFLFILCGKFNLLLFYSDFLLCFSFVFRGAQTNVNQATLNAQCTQQ